MNKLALSLEQIKLIFKEIIKNLKSKLKLISTRNVINITENIKSINIGLEFDKYKNVLLVFKDGKLLPESQYTISEDSKLISGTFNGTTENPLTIEFVILKNSF